MNIQTRLAKLEEASGINMPCNWCVNWEDDQREVLASLTEHGATIHRPKPADLKPGHCIECGRVVVYDQTFLTAEDRALYDQLLLESDACERENRTESRVWWQSFIGIFDREQSAMRAHYGEAFDRSVEQSEMPRFRRWMEEQMNVAA